MGDAQGDRLTAAREKAETKRRVEKRIETARRELAEHQSKTDELAAQLKKETADVRRLQRMSLGHLVGEVLGNLPARQAKEERERLATEAKFEAARQSLLNSEAELDHLKKQLADLANAEEDYQLAVRAREAELEAQGGAAGQRLHDLEEERAQLRAHGKELAEADEAGRAAIDALQRVEAELGSAANWGTWDMFGGGFLATMVKRQHMDRAQQLVEQAQAALSRFKHEMGDVSVDIASSLNMGRFMGFADFFFDNIFTDMAVQKRIRQALERVQSLDTDVRAALQKVEQEKGETQGRLEALDAERGRLIQAS